MDDLFKKFINTGVGFLSQGNKRIQTAIDQLVKDSKMSEQEGKKIMDELLKSGETKRKSLEKQFQSLTDTVRERVGLAPEADKKPAAKKASSPTAKVAGTTKKAADKVSDVADKAKRSAAAKAGIAKKKAAAGGEAK
ncbi:MAG: phasin family protein [Janthinobacterium lividum]